MRLSGRARIYLLENEMKINYLELEIDLSFKNATFAQKIAYIAAILRGKEIRIEIGENPKHRGRHHGTDISKSMLRDSMDQQSWN